MVGMMESVFPNVKNRSKTLTAEIEVPAVGGNGTIIAQGGRFGGWSRWGRRLGSRSCKPATAFSPLFQPDVASAFRRWLRLPQRFTNCNAINRTR